MCVKMYYFNSKHIVKKITSNQSIFVVELLSFNVKQNPY